MNKGNADRWLVTSAVVVGGTYALMKWKGKTQTSIGTFATAWGTVYIALALVTEASPQFGGAFSLLVMVGDLLHNVPQLVNVFKTTAPTTGTPAAGSALSAHPTSTSSTVAGVTGAVTSGVTGAASP